MRLTPSTWPRRPDCWPRPPGGPRRCGSCTSWSPPPRTPGSLAILTEAAGVGRRGGAAPIVVRAALATDRGFLRLGPAAPAKVAIVESALEVADADPATRARLLALLAEDLVSDVAGTRRTDPAR